MHGSPSRALALPGSLPHSSSGGWELPLDPAPLSPLLAFIAFFFVLPNLERVLERSARGSDALVCAALFIRFLGSSRAELEGGPFSPPFF